MKTNSNTYTIIYASVIVVIVAFLLAFVSQSLKDRQEANVSLDKKKQILYALNVRDLDDETSAQKYKELVEADEVIDENGKVLQPGTAGERWFQTQQRRLQSRTSCPVCLQCQW